MIPHVIFSNLIEKKLLQKLFFIVMIKDPISKCIFF
jgi:hypothetical protein